MYATVAAAAALHQVLLRSLGDDKVVVQNVASGLFCVLFVALGVVDRPTLLAASMLGYLISDSTSVTTASYAAHHAVTAMLLLVSLRGNGAYDDLTVVLGGYGEVSTILLCVADTFKQRPRLQKAYPRANRAARYAFALAFFVLRVGYWSVCILPWNGPLHVRLGLYALLGLQYFWAGQILKKVARSIDRFRRPRGKHRPVCGGLCLVANIKNNQFLFVPFMILIPNALFCLLLPTKLATEKHAALACMAGSLACLVAARFTEPGILPAAVDIDHDAPDAPVTHVLIGGKRVPLADRRARYSRYTDVIVARLDHYCSWIGSPVGARNHFYYVAFLFFSSLDVAVMGPASALRFVRLARSKHSIERVSPPFVVGLALLGCYCFGVLV